MADKVTPFTFVKALNEGNDITRSDDPVALKEYNPFIVNRSFSLFIDTVLYADEMNINNTLAKQLQFDYYLHSVQPRKRFTPWPKKTNNANLQLIQQTYHVNLNRALEIAKLLDDDQIEALKEKNKIGG